MRRILVTLAVLLTAAALCSAQTEKKQVLEGGGTGPYKAVAVGDASLPTHMIYRPDNLKAYVEKNGKIPVLVYANGGCRNSSLQMSRLLTEVASYGYLCIAIGPYEEMSDEVFYADWKRAVRNNYPDTKLKIIMANGEEIKPMTDAEKAAQQAQRAAQQQAATRGQQGGNRGNAAPAGGGGFGTDAKQLLDAVDWITKQNADINSEYYHLIDIDQVAAMGQSCGGAQVLAVTHDPRIKTGIILNSGMGDMSMGGASKLSLANLHGPMLYLNGGTADSAYINAQGDYSSIGDNIPVVRIETIDGHNGTYYEAHGGPYAVFVRQWLNWQFKGNLSDSAPFLNDEYEKAFYPNYHFVRKNW